jgi:superfamily I DNA/RNA helicase
VQTDSDVPLMTTRFLINDKGRPFERPELEMLRGQLDALDDNARVDFRDQNASAIVQHGANKFLIISGPGTGKSHLFLDRMKYWCEKNADARVLVTSFVRKLVADLHNDIDQKLSDEQRCKITALTLHKFARGIVEKSHGTRKWPLKHYFRIIGPPWKQVVWGDVLAFFPTITRDSYSWEKYEQQLHRRALKAFEEWIKLHEAYCKLCQFYNAAGFADLILRAANALSENPELRESNYFIIDEYQDFNLSEQYLIEKLVNDAPGLLIVGDDDQVLYETLKSGTPSLIRKLYKDPHYSNGMLPFCGRSNYDITKNADHFIRQNREADCIEKIYLPLKKHSDGQKVQIIACASAAIAADYIEKFVADNGELLQQRKQQLEAGKPADAFLLILTPWKGVDFYGAQANEKIKSIVAEYRTEAQIFSEDYYRLLSHYLLAKDPRNNFNFRKLLHYSGIPAAKIHELITAAMSNGIDLCDLDDPDINNSLGKCAEIKAILDSEMPVVQRIDRILPLISFSDRRNVEKQMESKPINQKILEQLEREEDEGAELEEVGQRVGAVELMTIVGSKGLSADHVIIVGFDNIHMKWVSRNAFYVAMTRARKSLHILTAVKAGGARQAHHFLDRLPDDHVEFYSYKKSDRSKRRLDGKQGFKKYLSNLNFAPSSKRAAQSSAKKSISK